MPRAAIPPAANLQGPPSTTPGSATRAAARRAIELVFFASGAAGLMFEMVWFHRCQLVFGDSVWSTSLVLSSFMGGLAIGNSSVRACAHRLSQPLRAYAALEALVGVTGIGLSYLLPHVAPALAPLIRPVVDTPAAASAIRLVASFVLLLVPATAMGATLPVLVPVLSDAEMEFGRSLGQLYGWNTLGAVTGVLAAEVLVIPRIGIAGTAWAAGAVNLAAASVALILQRRNAMTRPIERLRGVHPSQTRSPHRWLAGTFLAGATLLALEVVWFRFISMFVLSSSLIVSLMLAVVLAGIGLGGLAASAWLGRRATAVRYATAVSLLAAALSSGSYAVFQPLTAGPWTSSWTRVLWYTSVLTFGPSLLSGVLFTLVGARVREGIDNDIRAGGSLLLANTVGAMLGPLAATFVLLPLAGMERSFFLLAVAYCAVAALLVAPRAEWNRSSARATGIVAVVTIVLLARFPFGTMDAVFFPRVAATYAADGSRIVAAREGTAETILLMRQLWLGRSVYDRLVTNGFSMSGTHLTGKRYMRYFAYWPMLVRAEPIRHALVVCYGAGVTAGAVADISTVETIDVAETSRDIVAMSDLIYAPGHRPLDDRRVRLHLEDGRQLLQVSPNRYDLITGEPPPPLTPGAVNLYTREYFQLLYDRLTETGVVTYWIPVSQDGSYDVAPMIKAFCDVFEDCSLWNGTLFDWMIVGTRHLRHGNGNETFAAAWRDPVVGPHLREIGFETPQQIGATFLGDASYLRSVTARSSPVTDDFPRRLRATDPQPIAADAGNRSEVDRFRAIIDARRARDLFRQSPLIHQVWPAALAADSAAWFDTQAVINRVMLEGARPLRDIDQLHALLTTTSLRRLPLWLLGSNDVIQDIADTGDDGTGMVQYQIALRSLAIRNYREAANYLAAAERSGFRAPTTLPLRAYALCMSSQIEAARQLAAQADPRDADERHFWAWMESRFGVGPKRG